MSKSRAEDNPNDFRYPIQVKSCTFCGYNFARLKDRSRVQWDAQLFCSLECRLKTSARHTIPSERFEDNFIPEPNSGCWLWIGYMMGDGYGQIRVNGELLRAHRLSYRLHKGSIDGVNILHTCDNRLCVNPDHLYIGTHQQNMDDMRARGRSLKGERHSQAKLTEDHIRRIRSSSGTFTDIGIKFGISRPHAAKIIKRLVWTHVDG